MSFINNDLDSSSMSMTGSSILSPAGGGNNAMHADVGRHGQRPMVAGVNATSAGQGIVQGARVGHQQLIVFMPIYHMLEEPRSTQI